MGVEIRKKNNECNKKMLVLVSERATGGDLAVEMIFELHLKKGAEVF